VARHEKYGGELMRVDVRSEDEGFLGTGRDPEKPLACCSPKQRRGREREMTV
jgi:hypothetical protein